MIDTENLKVILDEVINQLKLISLIVGEEVNTGFIAWFNNNEGVVAAFSGLASVFVASVAIWYSIRANKKQKELQIELQKRQIKLDSYNIKIEYLKRIKGLKKFIFSIVAINENFNDDKFPEIIYQYKQILVKLDSSIDFNELLLIIDCNDEIKQQIDCIQKCYEAFSHDFKKLCESIVIQKYRNGMAITVTNNIDEKLLYSILNKNINELAMLLLNIIEILTKETDISKIDKIKAI